MSDYQTAERMARKRACIPLPDLAGKSVLDVGCDHGYWDWLAAELGCARVLGVDRNRDGKDLIVLNLREAGLRGLSDVCDFAHANVGRQWPDFGKFDVVFCFSMYHHVYESCGDHLAVWYWLWRHTGSELLWENPVGDDDAVVKLNVSKPYKQDEIRKAAEAYFDIEDIGPGHVPTRRVWRCKPRKLPVIHWTGKPVSGGGGASKAFAHANDRRAGEIAEIVGEWPVPGTLNLRLETSFGWSRDYYRAQVLDVSDRTNLNSEWKWRWARFYPVTVNGINAHGFRFEGESYSDNYLELIAPVRLGGAESFDVRSR